MQSHRLQRDPTAIVAWDLTMLTLVDDEYEEQMNERRLEEQRTLALIIEGYMNLAQSEPCSVSLKLLERKLTDAGKLEEVKKELNIQGLKNTLIQLVTNLQRGSFSAETKAALEQVKIAIAAYPRQTYVAFSSPTTLGHTLAGRIQRKLDSQPVYNA